MNDAEKIGLLVRNLDRLDTEQFSKFVYDVYKLGWDSGAQQAKEIALEEINKGSERLKKDLSILAYESYMFN